MIIKFFVDIVAGILGALIDSVSIVTLPVDLVKNLATIAAYGSWVVGSDVLIIFAACVVGWTTFRLAWSVAVFIWKMMPFT